MSTFIIAFIFFCLAMCAMGLSLLIARKPLPHEHGCHFDTSKKPANKCPTCHCKQIRMRTS